MNDKLTPMEILKQEHQEVLGKLDALQSLINNLENRDAVAAHLRELAAFFARDFWVHFDKEEKWLFPEFDSFMPRDAGPLAVMIGEHEVLRDTNEIMQTAITAYDGRDNSPETRRVITEKGSHFVEFLKNHIFKEDNILFRMAEMHLTPAQQERAVKLFHEIEKAGA